MDVDAYVLAHRAEWDRLDQLARRRRPAPEEVDELVDLYQRVATHLSVVRSSSPDPALVARLSMVVSRARAAVTTAHDPAWRDVLRFVVATFPAALYRARRWWLATAGLSVAVGAALAVWIATHPQVQASIASPEQIRQLVDNDFEDYYSAHPAGSFAAQVWTNNAWVAALCLALSVPTLGIGVLWVLVQNAANVGVSAGLMAAAGKTGLFLGLILPHGLLELTAVFVAAGTGLRLAWCVVDPGPDPRPVALAREGRAAGGIAIGLIGVLLISGIIEAFVTPSPLPTAARVGIGVVVEAAFLGYVFVLGRRAAAAGETGDLAADQRPATLPTAG